MKSPPALDKLRKLSVQAKTRVLHSNLSSTVSYFKYSMPWFLNMEKGELY